MKFADFSSLAVGDLNRDGRPDIAVGLDDYFYYGTLQILLSNGQGGFDWGPTFWDTAPTRSVTLADFNRDGWADLAAASDAFGRSPWPSTPGTEPPW